MRELLDQLMFIQESGEDDSQACLRKSLVIQNKSPVNGQSFFILDDGVFAIVGGRWGFHDKACKDADTSLPEVMDSGVVRGVNQGAEVDLEFSKDRMTSEQQEAIKRLLDRDYVEQAFLDQTGGAYLVKKDEVEDFAQTVIEILTGRLPSRRKFLYV